MLKLGWGIIFIGLTLVSCDNQELPRDVDYYAKHFDERRKKVAQCQAEWQEKILKFQKEGEQYMPLDQIKPSPNCKNAEQAEKQHILDLFHQKSSKDSP